MKTSSARFSAVVLSMLAGALPAFAQCTEGWSPYFANSQPEILGGRSVITASVVHDAGDGPMLYVSAHPPSSYNSTILRFNGTKWESLGTFSGASTWGVLDLESFDDGHGPRLYVSGDFTRVNNTDMRCIAKWDGATWSAGLPGIPPTSFQHQFMGAMAVYDDGRGPALYVIGNASLDETYRFARWDGTSVTPGASPQPFLTVSFTAPPKSSMVVHDDGNGPALYLTGTIGGVSELSAWNGSSWRTPIPSFSGGIWSPNTLFSFDADGPGGEPALLLIGGEHMWVEGLTTNQCLLAWDGTNTFPLGGGLGDWNDIYAFAERVEETADGPRRILYAGGWVWDGQAGSNVARWDGSTWRGFPKLDSATPALTMTLLPEFRGVERVFIGVENRAALVLDNDSVGPFLSYGTSDPGVGLAVNPGESSLFPAGFYTSSYRWDGSRLGHPIPDGAEFLADAFSLYDPDGDGPLPRTMARATRDEVSVWDGSAWITIGPSVQMSSITAVAAHRPAGSDRELLFVGGTHQPSGDSVPTATVAIYDGSAWRIELGTRNVNESISVIKPVVDGPAAGLYVGGRFSSLGGVSAKNIARWNNPGWSPLGAGIYWNVSDLTGHDPDGRGASPTLLYAMGSDNQVTTKMHVWNGAAWSHPAGAGEFVASVPREGEGPNDLYVAGVFGSVDGVQAKNVARYRDGSWQALGTGITLGQASSPTFYGIFGFDENPNDATPPAVFFTGDFTSAGGLPSFNVARWGCEPGIPCPADFDRNGQVDFFDYLDFAQAFASEDPRADFNHDGQIDFFDYLDFAQSFDAGC